MTLLNGIGVCPGIAVGPLVRMPDPVPEPSAGPSQVADTANKHFFGQTGLFLIAVDADALGEALRWEPSRNDELFPHLYGELDLGAVAAVLELRGRSDGSHELPELKS